MADSVDRVFVHALNTVKKMPRSGSTRPPTSDRLRLYGLYKQAMEGDVDGVMERPAPGGGLKGDDLQRERDKWDAWNSQKGLGRTEAKRRYIEVLIEIMHKYATSDDGQELVSELEFVWNQIKNNSPSSSTSSPPRATTTASSTKTPPSRSPRHQQATSPSSPTAAPNYYPTTSSSATIPGTRRQFQAPLSGTDGPMRILSPMSEQDEAEMRSIAQLNQDDDSEDDEAEYAEATEAIDPSDRDEQDEDISSTHRPHRRRRRLSSSVPMPAAPIPPSGREAEGTSGGGGQWWNKTVERALVTLSAEVAALREQISSGREWRARRERAVSAWLRWLLWVVLRHVLVDLVASAVILLTIRKFARREDSRRLEEHVRAIFRLGREFVVRYLLPRRRGDANGSGRNS